jgi:hypothetical protein
MELCDEPCKCSNLLNQTLKYVLIIQKVYRGHKQRKLVKNIYSKLPCVIQEKILDYVRRDFYYTKYVNTLGSIVEKKLFIVKALIECNLHTINTCNAVVMNSIYTNLHTNSSIINDTIKLYIKYYELLKNNYKFDLTIMRHLFYSLSVALIKLHYSNYQEHYKLIYISYNIIRENDSNNTFI